MKNDVCFELRLTKDKKVNAKYLLNIVNEITLIHNQIVKGELFSAGFNLCLLQQTLVGHLAIVERNEMDLENYCNPLTP